MPGRLRRAGGAHDRRRTCFPEPDRCTVGGADDTFVVTGSIYLIGEVFERIEPGRGAGEGRLQDFARPGWGCRQTGGRCAGRADRPALRGRPAG